MTRTLLAFLTTAAFVAACGDDAGAPPDDPPDDPLPGTVETVEVEGALADLAIGERVQLTARAFDADGQVITGRAFAWESDNAAVATVSDDGMVTAVAAGEVTIYATTGMVAGGTFLTVREDEPVPVAWIDVHPSGTVVLAVGATFELTATAYDANGQPLAGRPLTWSSGSTQVATVSASGVVTAVGPGDAWIAVECEGLLDEMVVRVPDVVDPPVAVDSVVLDYIELALPAGESMQLVAYPLDAQGQPLARPVTWSSNNPAYVSVDADGVVTAHEVGGADITATSEGKSASVRVYATHITDRALVALNGAALPTLLGTFTWTDSEGSTGTTGVRIYDGSLTIDHGSGTYQALVRGIYTTAGQSSWVPIPIHYESAGTVTANPATGVLTFTPDVGRAFTAVYVAGDLELHWQLDDRIAGEATLLFR
jgi:uncharacterized protein YjdB